MNQSFYNIAGGNVHQSLPKTCAPIKMFSAAYGPLQADDIFSFFEFYEKVKI